MDFVDLVGPCGSWGLGLLEDEEAKMSVKQLHPLDRLGPQVQIPLLEQEVLFILVTSKTGVSLQAVDSYLFDSGHLGAEEQAVNRKCCLFIHLTDTEQHQC